MNLPAWGCSGLAISLALCCAPRPLAAQDPFSRELQPKLQQYCLGCHSTAKHVGDLDLERFHSTADVTRHPKIWQTVVEQLRLGEMPPKGMPQPSPEERLRLIDSVRAALKQAAQARAGDPGPVVLRRLNNAEYTFTIRDLTHVSTLDPAREFPADGAAGEGFTNTGNSLAMSPALVTKYLDAAKQVAAHAVLLPDGLRFSPSTSRRDWTDEILSGIRSFYRQYTDEGGEEKVTQQGIALDKNRGGALPLQRYLAASLAVRDGQTVEAVARARKLSPKYVALLVKTMSSTAPSPVLEGLRKRWRTVQPSGLPAMAAEIALWQDTLWKFSSVGHIGKEDGPKAWMEPVTPIASKQDFQAKLQAADGSKEVTLYLAAGDSGDGTLGDAVVWQEPRILVPGRPPVRLRDVRGAVAAVEQQRDRIASNTARALNALAGFDNDVADATARKAWSDFLGVGSPDGVRSSTLAGRIEKTGAFDFVQGWGGGKEPSLFANSSKQQVRIPGKMNPGAVAVLPTETHFVAAGWRSPVASPMRIQATISPMNAECGNGVEWAVELQRGGGRQRLGTGFTKGATPVKAGPFEAVYVQPGDFVSLVIGPRDGNASCDLTEIEMSLGGGGQKWTLSADVAANVLASNPHADAAGREGIWHFYTEPVAGAASGTTIPSGSLLARWQTASDPAARRELASQIQRLLTSPAPDAKTPDGALYRQLVSLAGPFASGASGTAASSWGLDPAGFQDANLQVNAPSLIEVRVPSELVAGAEFSVTGMLDPKTGAEGSVQLQVLTEKPAALAGLRPSGTAVRTVDGTWSSNNQKVSYAMPVVVNEASAARKRIEANFDEFRQMFPASLAYTKIVPVDEVVTLTLFYREDQHLQRLLLNKAEQAKLDRMWDQLRFVSREPIMLADAFEQLWQYATQDADPSKFEPLRKPIADRAAAFRKQLVAAEPMQMEAVIEFANRAYRRPVTPEEKDELRTLYAKLRQRELAHEDATRLTLARVLAGPAFLYRTEKAGPGTAPAPVSDWEMATRLSFFLWSSMPDAELRAAAESGKLRTAEGLAAQTRRMLADARVRRLATEFGASWLHIRDFDTLDEKSERHFPAFRALRGDMYEETIRFFTDFFSSNRSILSLLDSDHTFLNGPLARFYGIDGVAGTEWQRVDGMRARSRGGVLGMATTLAKQSGASRTSPILRGNWISEVLLGDKLPRPPKDVPQLPEDEAGLTLTMRELTEKHDKDPRCYACHRRIDPYGFALEQFDAIGRWREKDLGGRPIHTKTKLMDGTEIEGLNGLRDYLLTKGRGAFVRQFERKLLGYALGRAVQLSDEPLLDEMSAKLAPGRFPVGATIEMIVKSRQFREIRGRDAAPEE